MTPSETYREIGCLEARIAGMNRHMLGLDAASRLRLEEMQERTRKELAEARRRLADSIVNKA